MLERPILLVSINLGLAIGGVLPPIAPGVSYLATLRGHGGIPPYLWAIEEGALPDGITTEVDTNGDYVFSGTSEDFGRHEIVVGMRDAEGRPVRKRFVLIVQAYPLVLTGTLPPGYVGVPYSVDITISGGIGPYFPALVNSSLPDGLFMTMPDPNTVRISGTPTTGQVTTPVRIDVADSQVPFASASLIGSIFVSGYAPIVVAGAFGDTLVGSPIAGSPRAISGGSGSGYYVELRAGTRPAGVTISVVGSEYRATGNTTTDAAYSWTDRIWDDQGNYVDVVNAVTVTAPVIESYPIYVSGDFTSITGTGRVAIAKLASDGTLQAWGPTVLTDGGPVYKLIPLDDDRVYVVGHQFQMPTGTSNCHVSRLASDGTLDGTWSRNTSYDPAPQGGDIQSDGSMIVSGSFSLMRGVPRNRIARLYPDGTLDTGYNPGSNAFTNCVALQGDGKAIFGGSFTSIAGAAATFIARLNTDGTRDTSFVCSLNGSVYAIAIDAGGKVLIGGTFTTVNGVTRRGLARLNSDGTLDTSFALAEDVNTTNCIAIDGTGRILVGGTFNSAAGVRVARFNSDGSLDTSFACSASGEVQSLAIQDDGQIVMGGSFTSINGTSRTRLARVDDTGALDASFTPTANNTVYCVVLGKVPE